jgi:hypothetical protein
MFVAILGDRRSTLPSDWTKQTVLAVAAETQFDASAGAGRDASLTFIGLFGDLEVRVPPGSRVTESGLSLVGDKEIQLSAGDGPQITVKVYGLFSDVKITDRPGEK